MTIVSCSYNLIQLFIELILVSFMNKNKKRSFKMSRFLVPSICPELLIDSNLHLSVNCVQSILYYQHYFYV